MLPSHVSPVVSSGTSAGAIHSRVERDGPRREQQTESKAAADSKCPPQTTALFAHVSFPDSPINRSTGGT